MAIAATVAPVPTPARTCTRGMICADPGGGTGAAFRFSVAVAAHAVANRMSRQRRGRHRAGALGASGQHGFEFGRPVIPDLRRTGRRGDDPITHGGADTDAASRHELA